MIPQFIGAFFIAVVVMVAGSLLWPKIMKRDRPEVLQAVHDRVVETEAGKKAEEVLGTVDIPENPKEVIMSVSSQAASQVGSVIQKKTEEIVTHRIIEEVVKRFETLPKEEKEQVQTVICKPAQ